MFDRFFDFLQKIKDLLVCFKVVDEYELGIVLRLGKYHRTLQPGFHWILPLAIDRVITSPKTIRTDLLDPQSLMTKDGVEVSVRGIITWKVRDMRIALLQVDQYFDIVRDLFYGAITEYILNTDYHKGFGINLGAHLTEVCGKNAEEMGVELIRVQLMEFVKTNTLRLLQSPQYNDDWRPSRKE